MLEDTSNAFFSSDPTASLPNFPSNLLSNYHLFQRLTCQFANVFHMVDCRFWFQKSTQGYNQPLLDLLKTAD